MVTGPAKNGHSCNQVWEAKGSGTRHSARLQASPHTQPPGCWQMLMATATSDLESSGSGSGMRLRRGHHVDPPVLTSPGLLWVAGSREVSGEVPEKERGYWRQVSTKDTGKK